MLSYIRSKNDNLVFSISLLLSTVSVWALLHSRQQRTHEEDNDPPNNENGNESNELPTSFSHRTSFVHRDMSDVSLHNSTSQKTLARSVDHHFGYDSTENLMTFEKDNSFRRPRLSSSDSKRAGIMPSTLTLIRHGESEGNVDCNLYQTKPDNAMRLTKLGWVQAKKAGKVLREQITQQDDKSIHFIISPYVRTMETFHGIASAWCDPEEVFGHIKDEDERLACWYDRLAEMGLTWIEDPRIREQDFGNYQDAEAIKKAKKERWDFGTFYYRFLNGESASDVFDRVSTFLDSMWRSFQQPNRAQNYVLVTHGISIRVLLSRYFRYTVDQFNVMKNPNNCEMIALEHDGTGRLQLNGRYNLEYDEGKDSTGYTQKVLKYKFHKILNVGPNRNFKKRVIRMSCNE